MHASLPHGQLSGPRLSQPRGLPGCDNQSPFAVRRCTQPCDVPPRVPRGVPSRRRACCWSMCAARRQPWRPTLIGADLAASAAQVRAAQSTCESTLSLNAAFDVGAQLASPAESCARRAQGGRQAVRWHAFLMHLSCPASAPACRRAGALEARAAAPRAGV